MSRRPGVSPDKAAQNQQTLKQLVKLDGNKSCADCKRNKHPRWASWNLGIFVCIRCSGIHRGMGTHISRVKSVDLDAWTDEQLQSMIKWGNVRANKYWEDKLAPGHVPAEAKIENFIRTKYDSKRWVMEGPIPDPSTLGDGGDDDLPLSVVQEKAKIDRASSVRSSATPGAVVAARRAGNNVNLFDDDPSPPARPSTTEPTPSARPPLVKAPAKQSKPGESLLGFDFFGGTNNAPPARPSSATATTDSGLPQRTDLKQSILSLYASAPKPAPAQSQTSSTETKSRTTSATLDDAFSSLNFGNTTQAPSANPAPAQTISSPTAQPATMTTSSTGGGFFDAKPTATQKPPTKREPSGFGDWGDFTGAASPPVQTKPAPAATSSMGDMFDFSTDDTPLPKAAAPKPAASNPPPINMSSYTSNSAFNLSTPAPAPAPKPAAAPANYSAMNGLDAWGSDNAWSTPDPEPSRPAPAPAPSVTATAKAPATTAMSNMSMNDDFGGWGSSDTPAKPVVTQDDDFGGWSHASPIATNPPKLASTAPVPSAAPAAPKPFTGGNDLFDNVWE